MAVCLGGVDKRDSQIKCLIHRFSLRRAAVLRGLMSDAERGFFAPLLIENRTQGEQRRFGYPLADRQLHCNCRKASAACAAAP
jgi:hypothetical protein